MEKLQAALEKARQNRSGVKSTSTQVRHVPETVGVNASVQALWENIPQAPLSDAVLREHLVVSRHASDAATPFDILRTKILLQMQQNGWKRLGITSPMPRSGKTTTSCNLTMGLGRQSGLRAMLFDLDLQSPSVHRFFDQKPSRHIGEVLQGQVPFAEQALRLGDSVIASMSDHVETDPTRILLSEEIGGVLDEIQGSYAPDIMIFDLPSVLVGDNTRAFLKNVDCALIVARADATRYNQFDACEQEIAEHTNVIGTVLNAYRYGRGHNSDH